jgi:hypothetical protein
MMLGWNTLALSMVPEFLPTMPYLFFMIYLDIYLTSIQVKIETFQRLMTFDIVPRF